MKCEKCVAMSINGVICHEIGCPDSWINLNTGKPYLRECKGWCGCDFMPETKGQIYCSVDCAID